MRVRTPSRRVGFGKRLIASVAALATIAGIGVVAGTGGTANAFGTGAGFSQFNVNGCGMPGGVKVRSWFKPGNYKTVVMLDGLRATNDVSGWEHMTQVQNMVDHGVNVVMPVGGAASFYSDWDAPSNFNNQTYTYKWNCVIANTLPRALHDRGMVPGGKLAVAGISMGGNAALVVAANNKRYYSHAFSMSGYLNLSAPGMKSAIRVALLDADGGPWNVDSMWGPPWSTRWYDNDPFVQITKMHGLKVRVGAGSGIPGKYNQNENAVSIVQGVPLEVLSLAQTRAFEVQAFVNRVNLTTDYPSAGTHKWGYWQDMMWRALQQGWFRG